MKHITIQSTESIREALKKIGKGNHKCIPVVDRNEKLLGTISDGDVRRAILKNININSKIEKIYNRHPKYFFENKFNEKDLREIFSKENLDIIPIINEKKKLVKVYHWHQVLNKKRKNEVEKGIPVIIMAGGKGTRLKPFTNVLPKPLIPIRGKTVIEMIISNFLNYGVNEFTLSINHKSEVIKAYFSELKPNYKIKFIEEKKPLGTVGSLRNLESFSKDDLFLINCDVIYKIDIADFYNFHKKNKNDITLVASDKEYVVPYGVCNLKKNGSLNKITEKPGFDFLINTGLYLLNKKVIKLIPKNKLFNTPDLINIANRKGYKIGVYPVSESSWMDVGQWTELNKIAELI